jgi:PIN domain nuclease of toxin-antitoxin system
MRLLLDTHAFLWWLDGDRQLPSRIRNLILDESNVILVSAATAWEISTKARIGKLPGALEIAQDIGRCILSQSFVSLDITVRHAQRAGQLPGTHRDPFDRMLAAQSQEENIPLASNEIVFDEWGVTRLW